MQHVAAVAHQADVLRRAVHALAVQNGPLKHVAELLAGAQEVGPDEVHHAPVLDEVVLEGVASEDDPAARADVLQGLRRAGVVVLDAMALVADHHVWAGPGDGPFNTWEHQVTIKQCFINNFILILNYRDAGMSI